MSFGMLPIAILAGWFSLDLGNYISFLAIFMILYTVIFLIKLRQIKQAFEEFWSC